MTSPTRPLLALYIAWHPDFAQGQSIAHHLHEHFRRKLFENVSGGVGISVLFRFQDAPGATEPLPVDLAQSETTATVVLVDGNFAADTKWLAYLNHLKHDADAGGLGTRLFPVAIEPGSLNSLGLTEQAFRWDTWTGAFEDRLQRLTGELTYGLCRMLRHYLEHLRRPTVGDEELEAYLRPVRIFLSHSKHDPHGEAIARSIRDNLHNGNGLAGFFDVHDIPAGLHFDAVLLHRVRTSAMVAIHTDSYSSREWCRREIIEAKRNNVPLVVANCINDSDERGFPYMGNVPIVRMDPVTINRIDCVVRRLLDEVLKDFLWKCQVELINNPANTQLIFIPRPPELVCLSSLPDRSANPEPIIVYPDPPLSAEEERLFADVAPHVQLRSLMEWTAGAIR
ncbi:toll/interleukin-1 receptor domain-containing protein [Rhodopseudomonas pseudopalustris]|uniref:toll/interleukin-1 receptor domain-containing protein n=1 Tax=Rhodopseudomonas pseudopalustris TaxID=1513892 RepID=UPI003F99721F